MFNLFKPNKHLQELEKAKKDLVVAIDDSINKSQQSIEEISKILIDFNKYKYYKHDSFLNLCIFSDIVFIDLTILLEKFRLSVREQEKRLYARVIAVTIVDYLDNINVLIGRDCLLELKNNNMSEFLDEIKAINKKLSYFKKDNERVLRDIRNNTIAHKTKDALKLNAHINNMDVEFIYNSGLELKIQSKEFIEYSTKVLYYIVDYMKEGRKL